MGRNTAIILSAGSGSRMGSSIPKQYLDLGGKPVLYYSLKAFCDCKEITDIILVVASDEDTIKCQTDIIDRYNIKKVSAITKGGAERYLSVYEGIRCIEKMSREGRDLPDVLMIHDGARCLIDQDTIKRTIQSASENKTGVAAVKVKDTIKRAGTDGVALETLPRDELWQIQTPQTFSYSLIKEAYEKLMSSQNSIKITDDAMVVERMTDVPVRLVPGSYNNIKITTPEDMIIARSLLQIL